MPTPKLLLFPTYVQAIKDSVGSHLFRHLYAEVDGKIKDITEDGRLSCALFVSVLLHRFGLLGAPHATVEGTVKDLLASGWKEVRAPEIGCVVVWDPDPSHHETHAHIGFVISKTRAVSNNAGRRVPAAHAVRYRPVRAFYMHAKLAS